MPVFNYSLQVSSPLGWSLLKSLTIKYIFVCIFFSNRDTDNTSVFLNLSVTVTLFRSFFPSCAPLIPYSWLLCLMLWNILAEPLRTFWPWLRSAGLSYQSYQNKLANKYSGFFLGEVICSIQVKWKYTLHCWIPVEHFYYLINT